MTEQQFLEKQQADEVTRITQQTVEPEPVALEPDLATYLAVLEALQRPKRHLTSAPTFIPRNLTEQIQFYDDEAGTPVRRVYFYFNGSWSYATLT